VDLRKLILGTAQWGMQYGIANRAGKPEPQDVAKMMALGWASGVRRLDTARAYGESENLIGELIGPKDPWEIVTKIDPGVFEPGLEAEEVRVRTRRSVGVSLGTLGRKQLDGMLLHRAEHRHSAGGAAWSVLREGRKQGMFNSIGVSVTTPNEAVGVVSDTEIELAQVPVSIFDQRLVRNGFIESARSRGLEVHIRSIFLQGVAFLEPNELPWFLGDLSPFVVRLSEIAAKAGTTTASLCLAFALSLPVDGVVIGVEEASQLGEIIAMWRSSHRLERAVAEAASLAPEFPPKLIEPFRWPQSAQNQTKEWADGEG